MLSETERQAIDAEIPHYARKQAVCIEALKVVQRHRGWVSDEALHDVAGHLEMTVDELDAVATFYNLIFREPVGRHIILICDSVSCWLMGYGALRERLSERLGVEMGQTTADGRFTLLPIVCLGACDHAPAIMVDEDLHRDVAPDHLDAILERYE
ncbi:MAG: NADH-quinone oxidoreductase subunit NuoE [Chthonomonadales bacterium]|nr:NADH-quinone oxidoreductase subunit NuoE [Chthonomonadales bacterium]